MKYYLIEAYKPGLKLEKDYCIISLTPLVSSQLDKEKIRYRIIEDYYDENDIQKEERDYYKEQIKIFMNYNKILLNIFPEFKYKNINLLMNYYFYLKCMIDSVVLRVKYLNQFIIKEKPEKMIYISAESTEKRKENKIETLLFYQNDKSLFSQIFPLICEKYHIDHKHIYIRNNERLADAKINFTQFLNKCLNILKSNRVVIFTWYYIKTFGFKKIIKKRNSNILFLKRTGTKIDAVIKDANNNGCQVFYVEGKNIYKQGLVIHHIIENFISDNELENKVKINDVNNILFSKEGIISWVNNYCGVDVSSIILPKLNYFIDNHCRQVISMIDKYLGFYEKYKIDIVFTPHQVTASDCAAIIAAKLSKTTKSACLQHGNDPLKNIYFDHHEYQNYEIYFTTDDEMEKYIQDRSDLNKYKIDIYQYPYRLEPLLRKKKKCLKKTKKTVAYVPTVLMWDNLIWFESTLPPDTWYFNWQKELLKLFNRRKDMHFIWKGIPASNSIYDPIPDIINDNKYENIKYKTDKFTNWLNKADLILFDFPSTALYEAAWSGLPVMSLYFENHCQIRETAKELFGKSLQSFKDYDDGIKKIEVFLNDDYEQYIIKIPYTKNWKWEAIKKCLSPEKYINNVYIL